MHRAPRAIAAGKRKNHICFRDAAKKFSARGFGHGQPFAVVFGKTLQRLSQRSGGMHDWEIVRAKMSPAITSSANSGVFR